MAKTGDREILPSFSQLDFSQFKRCKLLRTYAKAFLRMRTSFVQKVPFPSFPRKRESSLSDSGRPRSCELGRNDRSSLFGTRSSTRTHVRDLLSVLEANAR